MGTCCSLFTVPRAVSLGGGSLSFIEEVEAGGVEACPGVSASLSPERTDSPVVHTSVWAPCCLLLSNAGEVLFGYIADISKIWYFPSFRAITWSFFKQIRSYSFSSALIRPVLCVCYTVQATPLWLSYRLGTCEKCVPRLPSLCAALPCLFCPPSVW